MVTAPIHKVAFFEHRPSATFHTTQSDVNPAVSKGIRVLHQALGDHFVYTVMLHPASPVDSPDMLASRSQLEAAES